jgi:hypothetical protein
MKCVRAVNAQGPSSIAASAAKSNPPCAACIHGPRCFRGSRLKLTAMSCSWSGRVVSGRAGLEGMAVQMKAVLRRMSCSAVGDDGRQRTIPNCCSPSLQDRRAFGHAVRRTIEDF